MAGHRRGTRVRTSHSDPYVASHAGARLEQQQGGLTENFLGGVSVHDEVKTGTSNFQRWCYPVNMVQSNNDGNVRMVSGAEHRQQQT